MLAEGVCQHREGARAVPASAGTSMVASARVPGIRPCVRAPSPPSSAQPCRRRSRRRRGVSVARGAPGVGGVMWKPRAPSCSICSASSSAPSHRPSDPPSLGAAAVTVPVSQTRPSAPGGWPPVLWPHPPGSWRRVSHLPAPRSPPLKGGLGGARGPSPRSPVLLPCAPDPQAALGACPADGRAPEPLGFLAGLHKSNVRMWTEK